MAKMLTIFIPLAVLAGVYLVAKAIDQLSLAELRRSARQGNSSGLYKLASFGLIARFCLDFIAIVSFWVFIDNFSLQWWAIALLSLLAALLGAWWRGPSPGTLTWKIADTLASWLSSLLGSLHTARPAKIPSSTAKIYTTEDLAELLGSQATKAHNRIPPAEIKMLLAALEFKSKKVVDCMTPLSKARLVNAAEEIGPHLLDEMHKFHTDCFIVVEGSGKSNKAQAIGTLYLEDALAHSQGGTVKEALKSGVVDIDEDTPLISALDKFLTAKCHVMVVRNGFDEMVGVITLGSALEQIFGQRAKIDSSEKSSS